MTDLGEEFRASATLFPFMLDIPGDRVLIARIGEEDFRKASFLDQRMLTPDMQRSMFPFSDVASWGQGLSGRPDFIFHTGHVGSTLVARLLGELPDVLALREPLALRSLAELLQLGDVAHNPWHPQQRKQRSDQLLAWLSRGFRTDQRTIIKATSFVSGSAQNLLDGKNRALLLTVRPEIYIATILAGEASLGDVLQMASPRAKRLNEACGEDAVVLSGLDPAKRAALSWLVEMLGMAQAAERHGARTMWQDFDAFLRNPVDSLQRFVEFYDLTAEPDHIRALTTGPLMRQYSKAPEHGYSAALRQSLLDQCFTEHGEEIRSAMTWIEDLAQRHAIVEKALNASS